MAEKSVCTECGQSLVDGNCVNRQCSQSVEDVYGSLVPDEIVSMDPSQIIDYTGTLGVTPVDSESVFAGDEPAGEDADSAQTRMVDDNYYKQIREFFPADDSGSKSPESENESRSGGADASRSVNLQGVRQDFSIEEFVPPVRDIRFPSDTASLEELRELDPEMTEGDEYQIVEKLGEGGYGVVFEAEQVALNRPVAVKVLKPKKKKPGSKSASRSGTGSGELQRRRDQFLHEAKITARLQHPNIVPLYDFGINTQGQLFYSMKKVERRPWSSVIQSPAKLLGVNEDEIDARSDRAAIKKNVEIFDKVCDAMAYSHAQRIIHRDLKPDNIMIGDYGEVLLIDFGMALDFAAGQPEFSAGGTLVYMAPEMAEHFAKQKEIQLAAQKTAQKLGVELGSVFLDQSNLLGIGKLAKELIQQSKDDGVIELAETLVRLDAEEQDLAAKIGYASDIYLLGAILYQIAVGHPPHYFPIGACKKGRKEKFQKELWLALKNGFQQYQEVTDPLRISLRNIAVRAMRSEPENRFQTVEELQEAIEGFQLEVQSLEMTETGKEEIEKAKGGQGYQHLLPALESFRGASELWPESPEAKSLQVETACEYATRANNQKDFDAGLSIIDEYVFEDHQTDGPVVEVRKKLVDGKKRRARNRTLAVVGWFAAVALPIAVWGYSSIQLIKARDLTSVAQADAKLQEDEAKKQTAEAEKQKDIAAKEKLEAKKQTAEAEKQKGIAAKEKLEAEKQTAEAKLQKGIADKEKLEAKKQTAEAKLQKGIADKERAEVAIQKAEAARQKLEADKQKGLAEASKKEADESKFDVQLGVYNSKVLTIPLDLRTDKLPDVEEKLAQLAASDANPQLKNGWAVKHFSKRADVKGVIKQLDTSIVDIVSVPNSKNESIVVGLKKGKPSIWKMQANGDVEELSVGLPTSGEIADMSISADGQWLAFAVDNESTDYLWVVNIKDGTRAKLQPVDAENAEKGDGVIGCRVVEFSDTVNGIQLATVEELSGDRSLQQRVRVVTRTIAGGVLSPGKVTEVSATTRDLGRVKYLADANWYDGQLSVGLAYTGLDSEGGDVFRLETLIPNGAGGLASSKMDVEDFPTAVHAGPGQKFYCGYPDGAVDQFDANTLTKTPTASNNFNENEVVSIRSTDDGELLISGSKNGALIVRNKDYERYKKLQGQPGQLSALTVGVTDPENGATLLSGDKDGYVRVWEPEMSIHDAAIRKNSKAKVTCGTVDAGLNKSAVPAVAYGTDKGKVYYFSAEDMRKRRPGQVVGDANSSSSATFGFASPFESFESAFNNFDSMGIVGNHFVLMRNDGTFFYNFIDETYRSSSPRSDTIKVGSGKVAVGTFIPLMASVHDKDYFFTTDPAADDKLIYWKKTGGSFSHQSIDLANTKRGRVKRLSMSPDGNWLAVVRQLGRKQLAGKYIVQMYDVSSGTSSIRFAGSTEDFQVGDPAFVGFSPASNEMILHFHKRAPDRETWGESWKLEGDKWVEKGGKRKIDDRRVDLIDWDRSSSVDRLITRVNRKFYLASPDQSPQEFQVSTKASSKNRLRSVRPMGKDNKYYGLVSDQLNLYEGTQKSTPAESPDEPIEEARDLRVFGDQAVMLDKNGFHLFDSELKYVTKLAAREYEVKSLSLSTGRLAVLYSNNYCRIWDVRGESPQGIGEIENAKSVELSPDGKWAICRVEDSLRIYDIGSKFDKPIRSIDVTNSTYEWTGEENSKLLFAEKVADKINWNKIDPATGNNEALEINLPTELDDVLGFELAPRTGNYVAIESTTGLSLWAVSAGEPVRLNNTEHKFDDTKLKDIDSFSFSELAAGDSKEYATRFVVLANDESPGAESEPRLYLLASDRVADENADEDNPVRYRVVEIEGALEKKEGLDLIDCEFSGDGKSLIQVDEKGISALLGE